MLIICTADHGIVETALDPWSGSYHWGNPTVLPAEFGLDRATDRLCLAIRGLGQDEPFCLSAHGNDETIGDDHWHWSYREIAELLARYAPGYRGRILIHACAPRIVSFSAHLAATLEENHALWGTWIYGYTRDLPVQTGFPRPGLLDEQVVLRGMRVGT